jgi:hypothetical protein
MPSIKQALALQVQGDTPTLWAIVDTDSTPEIRTILAFWTGQEVPDVLDALHYLGTVQIDGLVWHYFMVRSWGTGP